MAIAMPGVAVFLCGHAVLFPSHIVLLFKTEWKDEVGELTLYGGRWLLGRRITPRPTRLLLHLSRCKGKGTHMGTLPSHHIHTPGRRKEAVKRGTTSFLQRNTHGNTIIDILQEGGKRQLGEEPRPINKQLLKNCVGCANQRPICKYMNTL